MENLNPTPRQVAWCLLFFTSLLWSCDVLQSDPDLDKPLVQVTQQQVYAMANGSTQIDLQSRIQSGQSATLTITSPPRLGKLVNLGKGLLLYSTTVSGRSQDSFTFSITDNNNRILARDSISIIVSDSTQLPCGFYATNDPVFIAPGQRTPVNIDVILNDYTCNSDSSDIKLEVLMGDTTSAPGYGTAAVIITSGNKPMISYTPSPNFPGHDKFVYRISSIKTPSRSGLGTVYIVQKTTTCQLTLKDDEYTVHLDSDSTSADGFFGFNVFQNDTRCSNDINTYTYSISSKPKAGVARISSAGLQFKPNDLPVGQSRIDSVRYAICQPSGCGFANVVFVVKH